MWGTPRRTVGTRDFVRFIPTDVGNTRLKTLIPALTPVHPHRCGEHFAQLERLGDENLKGKELAEETSRAKHVAMISKEIISQGQLMIDAQQVINESGMQKIEFSGILANKNEARILTG